MVSTYNEIFKIGRRNFFMEIFETYLNDFLYDLKSETLNSLLEVTDEYNELYD